MQLRGLVIPLFLTVAVPAWGGEAPRRFTYEDLVQLERVSDPQVAPNGDGRVCFVRSTPDPERNQTQSTLWLAPAGGGPARQLTFPQAGRPGKAHHDHSPRFSPDGQRVAFLSDREGSEQVYLIDLRGGEAQRLTHLPGGAEGLLFAPDGASIVVETAVFPDCPVLPAGDECNRRRTEALETGPIKARVIDRLFYRHWDSWFDGRRRHLVRVQVPGPGPARTPFLPVDLTPGDVDSPSLALEGSRPYVLSPDGKELAVVQNRDRDRALSTNNDIYVYPLDGVTGPAKPRNLTAGNPANDHSPRYSPDGRYLAYLAHRRPGFEADRNVLFLLDRKTGKARPLTEALDATVEDHAWAPDSGRIYFTTSLLGRGRVFVVGLAGEAPAEVLTADAHNLQVGKDALYFAGSSLTRAQEVYRVPLGKDGRAAGPAQQVSGVNDAAFARLQVGKVTDLWTQTADGRRLHSFLIVPPGVDPSKAGKRYPAVVLVHGGPQGAWTDLWHWRWNPQVYAGAGYVVLMVNPRGSDGFGQRFVDEVSGDWGGKAYDDVMRATDALIALPFVDRQRVGALGASYGGYMVNWIAGHTDRFAALVSHDGVYDLRSMAGETEEVWFPRWEMGGHPWESDQYDRFSPSRFADKFKTPMLVITNERDYRVPVGQGMQLFTALQLRKVPSRMVIFPDENHWVLKPGNSRLWYATVLDWLHRYLGGAPASEKILRQAAVYAR
jgi:dipeptidyl aminopeptidase/acylaminoacyl peptidase